MVRASVSSKKTNVSLGPVEDIDSYLRADWRLDSNGTPRLLEVKPNPGWCWDGHLAKMAGISGLSYAEMLRQRLQASEKKMLACKQ